jgi:transposase
MPPDKGFGMADKKTTNALYLPDWTVEDVKKPSAKTYLVEAAYDAKPNHCPKCGSLQKPYRHGPITVDYTDAPVHGRQTTVRVTVQRYRCRDCGKTFNQHLPDMYPSRLMTKRLVSYVEDQGFISTYAKVSTDTGLNEKTVRDICNAQIDRMLTEHRVTAPVVLGIDELTLDGGHRRSIFTDVGERRILDLIESMNRTPKRLFVCESCLGQYPVALSEWHRWNLFRVPHHPGAKLPQELCATCHRLHIEEWLHGRPVSTRKSG